MSYSVLCACILILAAMTMFFANRFKTPSINVLGRNLIDQDLPNVSTEIRVLTWNIGYSALGKDAEFYVDGGQSFRRLSATDIFVAADKIALELSRSKSDCLLIQENAGAGFLTRGVPVRHVLEARLGKRSHFHLQDLWTVLLPAAVGLNHGISTYSSICTDQSHSHILPQDQSFYFGCIKKHYNALVSKHPIQGSNKHWVVVNAHLVAFDSSGNTSRAQLKSLLRLAQKEFEAGNFVVIGADWNTRLSRTSFPHQTEHRHISWLNDLPDDILPDGWGIAIDEKVPTFRSLEEPYKKGVNYTSIIDGFVYSPNVEVMSVRTIDHDFDMSDHHPVEATFIAIV